MDKYGQLYYTVLNQTGTYLNILIWAINFIIVMNKVKMFNILKENFQEINGNENGGTT